jgi:hypothetical protein
VDEVVNPISGFFVAAIFRRALATSCQATRPRSPNVQKTIAATCTSSAKYCTNVEAAENSEPKATPASTTDSQQFQI